MAQHNGTDQAPEEAHGNGHAPEETRLERLRALVEQIDAARAKLDEARGVHGNHWQAVELAGGHRKALKRALELRDMEAVQRRDYLTNLNNYCDMLNVFGQGELFEPMPRPPAPPPHEPTAAEAASRAQDTLPNLGVTLPPDHHAQGHADGLAGLPRDTNPWPEGEAHAAYAEGWHEGDGERRAMEARLRGEAAAVPKRTGRRRIVLRPGA